MITNYYGTIVVGSSELETSVANQEIVPNGKKLYNFELFNDQSCTMSINNGAPIFIRANQGIKVAVLNSCKINESSITYNWIGVIS